MYKRLVLALAFAVSVINGLSLQCDSSKVVTRREGDTTVVT